MAFFVSASVNAQNLVPNPSFENYNVCPAGLSGVVYDPNYNLFPTVRDWVSPLQSGSPDYFHDCATTPSGAHVPETAFGTQYAHVGQAFTGIYAWGKINGNAFGEYLQCKLLQPMLAGQRYCVTFYVSATVANKPNVNYIGIDNIAVNFSTTKVDQTSGLTMSLQKDVSNTPGNFINDTNSWVKVSGTYTATGGERWLTLGMFMPPNTTPAYVPIKPQQVIANNDMAAYLFVDDVSVLPITKADTVTTSVKYAVCDPNNVFATLHSTTTEGIYQWGDGSLTSNTTVYKLGTYWCRSYANCQVHIDTFNVVYDPNIKLYLGRDTGNCLNMPVTLKPNGIFKNMLWSTGATSNTITVTQSGSYILHATNDCGSYSDTINVFIQPPTAPPTISDTSICQFTDQPLLNAIGQNIKWYNSTGFLGYTDNPYIHTQEPGKQIVYVSQTVGNCESERVGVNVEVKYQPHEELPNTLTLCEKSNNTIGKPLPEGVSYRWNTGENTCCVKPNSEGTYRRTISNECGIYIDTINIKFSKCEECLVMPNAFTPDNDGKNDRFKSILTCPVAQYRLSVYNRWGNKVFETTNPEEGWDGSYKNKACDNGGYMYSVQFRTLSNYNPTTIQGIFLLVR